MGDKMENNKIREDRAWRYKIRQEYREQRYGEQRYGEWD